MGYGAQALAKYRPASGIKRLGSFPLRRADPALHPQDALSFRRSFSGDL